MTDFSHLRRVGYRGPTGYDVAQVCVNGHMVNSRVKTAPQHSEKFCGDCGAKTITACPSCSTEIRGHYHNPRVNYTPPAPAFCHDCGKPYPWTSARVEAAKALADEISELDDNEKILLKSSIDDIITDTPKTQTGIIRFKKYITKGSKEIASAIRDVLVDVVSETAKKALWP